MIAKSASSQVSSDDEFVEKCSKGNIHPALAFGTYIGGQINSGGFYFKSGTGAHVAVKADLTHKLSIGIGGGIEKLQKEWMYPIFLDVTSKFSSKQNTGFFILQTGYSFSYLEAYEDFEGYDGKGGFMISPGWGYCISLRGKTDLFFTAQYRHQSFRIDYSTDNGVEYRDRFSYSFFVLKTGLSF